MPRPNRPLWLIIVLAVLFLGGAFLTVTASKNLVKANSRKDWPVASGRVVKSESAVSGIIRPMVIYAFQVDKSAYVDTTDLQVPGFGNKSKQFEVAHELLLEYPVGKEVLVHYDPGDFTNSVLIVTPRWNTYGQIGLGVVIFTVSLFFLILPRPLLGVREN
ncbi:MAG TPA: DUF3592 domain-containing protein [candidate division Zixibacteria bacterium]|nr:DUF3592 domain-containing protein [candidate division Zixibacteria bacterium]